MVLRAPKAAPTGRFFPGFPAGRVQSCAHGRLEAHAYNPRFPRAHPSMLLPERVVRALALSVAITMAAFVLFGAQQAGEVNPVPGPYFDKLVHAAYYGVMAILVDRGLGGRLPIIAMAAAIVVGAADEIHQLDVPGREASVYDWAADVVGAVVFTLLWRAARRAGRRRT